jgi:hypothetical protein
MIAFSWFAERFKRSHRKRRQSPGERSGFGSNSRWCWSRRRDGESERCVGFAGDIASDPSAITWRKEFDRRRRGQTMPIPGALGTEVWSLRAKLEAFGDDWLFPQSVGDQPWTRPRRERV